MRPAPAAMHIYTNRLAPQKLDELAGQFLELPVGSPADMEVIVGHVFDTAHALPAARHVVLMNVQHT